MKIWLSLTIVFLATLTSHAAIPVVTNVVAVQRAETKLIDITYDVEDADGDPLKIRVEVSSDGGANYSVPAFTFTGDIGDNITPGTNKAIVWDAGADWDGEYSDQMRVKVIAVDAQGYPGLLFGNEVPPGGFLMGQDGGAEGSGPSKHINIPWSYWLSKYEITNEQYADFLNIALAAGEVFRVGSDQVKSNPGFFPGVPGDVALIEIGDDHDLRWNVNNIEVTDNYTNFPVRVTWYGAMAFANHYGYDLPTEAEWEKATRGPDHDDEDEHLRFPWGDSLSGGNANYSNSGDPYHAHGTSPVGYFDGNQSPFGPDMVNGFGLYDLIGNVAEWTRTSAVAIDEYEAEEALTNVFNEIRFPSYKAARGGAYNTGVNDLATYASELYAQTRFAAVGFRVVRRSIGAPALLAQLAIFENFDANGWTDHSEGSWSQITPDGTWSAASQMAAVSNSSIAYSGDRYIEFGASDQFGFPSLGGNITQVVFKARLKRAPDSQQRVILQESDGSSWANADSEYVSSQTWTTIFLTVPSSTFDRPNAGASWRLDSDYIVMDDLQIYTLP